MPNLDDATLTALATLARLDLTGEDLARLRHDLGAILAYVERLGAFDEPGDATRDTVPAAALRSDESAAGLGAHELGFAPERREGLFVVPRTIDQG